MGYRCFSLKLAQLIAVETLLDHCGMQQLEHFIILANSAELKMPEGKKG